MIEEIGTICPCQQNLPAGKQLRTVVSCSDCGSWWQYLGNTRWSKMDWTERTMAVLTGRVKR